MLNTSSAIRDASGDPSASEPASPVTSRFKFLCTWCRQTASQSFVTRHQRVRAGLGTLSEKSTGKALRMRRKRCETEVPPRLEFRWNWRHFAQVIEYRLYIVRQKLMGYIELRSPALEDRRSLVPAIRTVRGRLCIILGLWFVSLPSAYAQRQERSPEPTLVRGSFTLESSLGIEAEYDSNIFQSATNVQSSQLWELTPSLLMRFEPGRSRLEFGYDGDYAWYEQSSNDDYANHEFEAGAYLLLGERSGLDIVASYKEGQDKRGTELTQGSDPGSGTFPEDPDRYTTEQFLGRYTYGVSQTRAFVALEVSAESLTYKNNRARTRQFDRDDNYGQVTFGFRVRPKTSLQLRVRTQEIEYDNPRVSGVNPDSRENSYLLGVVWEATAKTTGTVLVGRVEKKFVDPARPDFSGPNWEVAIRWSPKTYSHFDLVTERHTDEPVDLLGDVTDSAIYSLGWSHEWNSRLGSRITVSILDQTYRFVIGDRKDESQQYGAALIYKMRPWLRLEAGFDINTRDSDLAAYNYDQTIARLGAWITF